MRRIQSAVRPFDAVRILSVHRVQPKPKHDPEQQQEEHGGGREPSNGQIHLLQRSPQVNQHRLDFHQLCPGVAEVKADEASSDGIIHRANHQDKHEQSQHYVLRGLPPVAHPLKRCVLILGRFVAARVLRLMGVQDRRFSLLVEKIFEGQGSHKAAIGDAIHHHESEASRELRLKGITAGIGGLDDGHIENADHEVRGEFRRGAADQPIPHGMQNRHRDLHEAQRLQDEVHNDGAKLEWRPNQAPVCGEHRGERHLVVIQPSDRIHETHGVAHTRLCAGRLSVQKPFLGRLAIDPLDVRCANGVLV
mmetsp:Transcript_106503/g.306155  ORF Transcript_106503/g.306155 Transcript_106503/m.306155 type:complete len:306 (+) Transcript_106503:1526-2443(+)